VAEIANMRSVLVLLVLFDPLSSEAACTGRGNSAHDWLVNGCGATAQFSSSTLSDGSVVYSLSNGIITRELTHDAATKALSTTAVSFTGEPSLVDTVVPEASLLINGVPVQIGGVAGQIKDAHMALFSSVRSDLPAVAGEYTWIPGVRGSNPHAAWPPKGSRSEFDHVLSCGTVQADGAGTNDDGWVTVTVAYEQYDGTSGFSRRLMVSHNCSGATLLLMQVHTAYMGLANSGHVEFNSDSESSLTRRSHLADGTAVHAQLPYSVGEGTVGLAPGEKHLGYLLAEIFHSTPNNDPTTLGGVDRYARESARFWRLVTPQIEQMVVYVQGICVGGNKEYPEDGTDGTVGFWCYDDEGTKGMELLIDQTKEMKTDMLVFGQNLNQSWRSMISPEFNSAANLTWFSKLVARAHNTTDSQHSVEVGVYQLLLNARSATALNQAAPHNAFNLPNHGYDAMDPTLLLPDHNHGNTHCAGGPSCSSLCAGTSFFQDMKTSMLEFWRTVKLSAIDQDGSRYVPCANASHEHHHGLDDSMRVQFEQVKSLFHNYLDIPSAFPSGGSVPKVAFVTSASTNFLEAGQTKTPGYTSEDVWSLPRWRWIDLQRVIIISGINRLVNVQRYFPVPLSMPYHNVQQDPKDPFGPWTPCYGYQTNATLTPLEEHLPELNWVLSQTFGTGTMAQLRSRYLYDGPQSKALLQQWISWFRKYSGILSQDFITLSLTTSCTNQTKPWVQCSLDPSTGIDAIVHHGSRGLRKDFPERAMVMVWNPSQVPFNGNLIVPLYYSGLTQAAGAKSAGVSYAGAEAVRYQLSEADSVDLKIQLGPRELTWIVIED
jgi:hypothetical protein